MKKYSFWFLNVSWLVLIAFIKQDLCQDQGCGETEMKYKQFQIFSCKQPRFLWDHRASAGASY
jgi:hypothetical protein